MTTNDNYVLYSPDVETPLPDEEKIAQQIAESLTNVQQRTAEKRGHAMRAVHSKSHGALKGELIVLEGLSEEHRQGIFAKPGSYGAMVRYSTPQSDHFADSVGGVRGLALKVLGVIGKRDPQDSASANTQDFLMVNHPIFPVKDSKGFLTQAKLLDKVVSHVPEPVQVVQDKAVRMAGDVARAMGFDPIGMATGLAKANTNILGDTFYSGVPIRYGKYIAKVSISPVSDNLRQFVDKTIDESDHDALRHAVADFFATQSGEWELRIQLCKDLESMPVEDPSIEWSEEISPYVAVAKLLIPSQRVLSEEREKYSEDVLSFNPWNTVEDHRPLGSIMRARKLAYDASSKFRHSQSGEPRREPKSIDEMPD